MIVEGADDLHSVVGLMQAHIDWPNAVPPVCIQLGGSRDEILTPGYLTAVLNERGLQVLGVILDADDNTARCYERARALCATRVPSMPVELPTGGMVTTTPDGKRFGLWIMPDNASPGNLETFLRFLVAPSQEHLWQLAVRAVQEAREAGADCREPHVGKAELYTYLAWHDPPGRSPGLALTQKVLDPHRASAGDFVAWFRSLYEL